MSNGVLRRITELGSKMATRSVDWRGMLRFGKILSHKRFQFVCMPSWYLISRHDVLIYRQSDSHKVFTQKIRHHSFRSDVLFVVVEGCQVTGHRHERRLP